MANRRESAPRYSYGSRRVPDSSMPQGRIQEAASRRDFRYQGIGVSMETIERGSTERQLAPTIAGIQAGHVARYRFAASRVKGRVLDAACGCGYGSWMMHSERAQITGIDLEESAITYAKLHYSGPDYRMGDVAVFEGAYDWVVSFETIEHLPDPAAALGKFRASTNLICSTPNQERYPFRPESYAGDRFPHIRHWTPSELDGLLRSCGWKVIERRCQRDKTAAVTEGTDGMFLIYIAR